MCSRPNLPRAIAVIPARLASTRLPRKVLREVAGRPLLAWVVDAALRSGVFERVLVAADSEEVAALCRAHDWEFRMTFPGLPSGTDRVHAVAQELASEDLSITPETVFVNIQGDEPLLRTEHFAALLSPFAGSRVEVATLSVLCRSADVNNPNVVKVVLDRSSNALYFSRAPIPWDRDGEGRASYAKHLGIYAYRARTLARFAALAPARLETTERLEQLRLLENGIPIHVAAVEFDTIGVDMESDLGVAEAILLSSIPHSSGDK